jgi:RNA-directed DNA polymerase
MELSRRKMPGTPSLEPDISTKRRRIAELARTAPELAFTTLAHHMDLAWMHEAYRLTRKDGAVGVDGQDALAFAENLEDNLQTLLALALSGTYRAPPVRRVYIPKSQGKSRPIGIPTFADKVLQRGVTLLLEPIYEQDFLDCSYGFRPGRSAHGALDALRSSAMGFAGGWLVEIDIQGFFDTIGHYELRAMLRRRIRDGVVLRLIGKWLKAGVMEDGRQHHPEAGSPQGGVISPLLSNVYLHEVLDQWFEQTVRPRLQGRGVLVRYADDAVLLFEQEADARRVLDVLPKRFARYGLTLHPDKTRLVRFQRPPWHGKPSQEQRPETFCFLGFLHYWGRTRRGGWAVKHKTATDRFSRAVVAIGQWCRRNRHRKVADQWRVLCQKLRGHYEYYGMKGNYEALRRFRRQVWHRWRAWLSRRSQRARISWERWLRLEKRYPLPLPRIRQAIA